MPARAKTYAKIYERFTADIAQGIDCGYQCAPLNGGMPVCCSTEHAIPVVSKAEWKHLKKRTDIWKKFKPYDRHSEKIVEELDSSCKAIECSIAPVCQRDNRTLACRAFPFFPYMTKDGEIVGLSYYHLYEDRCWVISNLTVASEEFRTQMLKTYEDLFAEDEDEREAMLDHSAHMRRVFSRQGRAIPILGRGGELLKVLPKSGGKVVPAKLSDFKRHGPYKSQKAYEKAIKEAGGDPTGHVLKKA